MKTEIFAHSAKSKALRELKFQLCRKDRTAVHCAYFFDEMDEMHKVLICYYV